LVGGGLTGALAVFILLVLAAGAMYWRSRSIRVDHHNVNDDWSVAAAPEDRVPVPVP
jgi:PiT family inorganic phosphate transporter